jgi:oligopeptide/dipeptide ABC transporter ATP-binding protein
VEEAATGELFADPLHPYSMGLLGCIPTLKTDARRLYVIEGNIPDPTNFPPGCPFNPRCRFVKDVCREAAPESREYTPGHKCACHFAGKLG